MKSVVWLSFFGAGAMAHPSGLWWGTDQCYPSPENLDNACLPSQEGGFDWSELGNGDNWTFEGFNFNGFDASDVCGNSGGKCIQAKLSRDDNYNIRVEATDAPFSVSTLHMSTSRDTLVIMSYHMPSGSVCRQYVQSSPDGVDVTNEQCGGAVAVDFTLPEDSKFGECDMAIHRMDFDCSPGPKGPPEMPHEEHPSPTPEHPASTPVHSTAVTSVHWTHPSSSPPMHTTSIESWTRPTTRSVETSIPWTHSEYTHSESTYSQPTHSEPTHSMPAHTEPMEPWTTTEYAETSTSCTSSWIMHTTAVEVWSTTEVVETSPVFTSSWETHSTPVDVWPTEQVSESSTSCTGSTDEIPSWSTTDPVHSWPTTEQVPSWTTTEKVPHWPTTDSAITSEATTWPAMTHSLPAVPTGVDATTADVQETTSSCTSSWITYTSPVETWTTSTVWSTAEITISSCAPTATNCPPHSTAVITSSVAVSTTVCPYTSMETTSVLTTWIPETVVPMVPSSTHGAAVTTVVPPPAESSPVVPAPCPEVVPKCLNTWLTIPQCDSNSDAGCFCPSSEFTEKVTSCIHSWGESTEQVESALSYFAGICAPYIPSNPEIIDIMAPCPTGPPQEGPHHTSTAPVSEGSSPVETVPPLVSSVTEQGPYPTSDSPVPVHTVSVPVSEPSAPGETHTVPAPVMTSPPEHGVPPVSTWTAPGGHVTSAPTSYSCPSTTMTWSSHTVTVPMVEFSTVHSGHHTSVALVPGTSGKGHYTTHRSTCTSTAVSSFSTTTSKTTTHTAHGESPTTTVPHSNSGSSLSLSSLSALSVALGFLLL
ncbi:hypothetical protein POX_e06263 [Penicillium oxalicum]|uniref:hypothetical protein n=1 Tax=Penicillium oxalicum TaxID=69781 RepID=UPI0020B65D5D|nr:hypothetical protein POX_e06263 [Penicillium oxalicum]KAI2788250.1 hypothetical protein POX_e06263 [Penicillium oxalicum]